MVYFFVNKDGTEGCANEMPNRNFGEWIGWKDVYGEECTITTLPNGTIEKVIGKKLTWEDEPYEYSGVQSVDENPKEKLVSIDKVREWLKENIDIYAKVVINHKSNYPEIVMCDTFEKNFIKAMER